MTCCASGSCEVCRRPQGYSQQQREQIRRDLAEFVPIWRRENRILNPPKQCPTCGDKLVAE